MDFSNQEMRRRFSGLREIMSRLDLDAVIIMGDTVLNGPFINFSQRYFTQNNLIESYQILFLQKEYEPLLISAGPLQYEANIVRSQISNCIVAPNQISKLIELLKDSCLCAGRVGCTLDMLPASWYKTLREQLPALQLIELNREIISLHFQKSEEEIEKAKVSASLADKAYARACSVIRAGRAEYEVTAEIEYEANRLGACKNFTLITSGSEETVFSSGIPKLYPASKRILEGGDTVLLEITPQFDGYWVQLLRTVCIADKPTSITSALHRVCVDVINYSLNFIKPGVTVKDIWAHMHRYVTAYGFVLQASIGHVASVDLVDDRLTSTNPRRINSGETLIIHPCVCTQDQVHCFTWGQTYLVTENGAVSLNRASDELICVNTMSTNTY